MSELCAYVCSHVFEGSGPILLVSREGGDWQFLCGGEHPMDEIPRVVGLNHLIHRDPTLAELLELPVDWEASRESEGASWSTHEISDQR